MQFVLTDDENQKFHISDEMFDTSQILIDLRKEYEKKERDKYVPLEKVSFLDLKNLQELLTEPRITVYYKRFRFQDQQNGGDKHEYVDIHFDDFTYIVDKFKMKHINITGQKLMSELCSILKEDDSITEIKDEMMEKFIKYSKKEIFNESHKACFEIKEMTDISDESNGKLIKGDIYSITSDLRVIEDVYPKEKMISESEDLRSLSRLSFYLTFIGYSVKNSGFDYNDQVEKSYRKIKYMW